MSKRALTTAAIGLLLLAAGAARADEPALDERIDISLEKAKPKDTFRTFARIANFDVAVDDGVTGEVTVRLEDVRLRTALDVICESIRCRWDLVPGTPPKLKVVPDPDGRPKRPESGLEQRIDIKVTKADVRDLLTTFAELLGVGIELDPAVTGQVDLLLEKTPVGKGLDQVCAKAGCRWELAENGGERVLKVSAKGR